MSAPVTIGLSGGFEVGFAAAGKSEFGKVVSVVRFVAVVRVANGFRIQSQGNC